MFSRFAIIVNRSKPGGIGAASYIDGKLKRRGKSCVILEERKGPGISRWEDVPEGVECLIVLGGDGTLLEAAASARYRDIPVIGVNLGTLGYLAEVEIGAVDDALEQLCAGECTIEERMMLSGEIGGYRNNALNDIVITRSGPLQVVRLFVSVNGQPLTEYQADGIILSTPTGSTGYNLSAGGPIVSPGARMVVMTPISPHTLSSRSIVFSPDDVISVGIGEARDGGKLSVEASFDGGGRRPMSTGEAMTIRRAEAVTKILRLRQVSFLEVLRNKLV